MLSPWLIGDITPAPGRVRLFCLPYAGAGASVYLPWRRELNAVDVCPVRLPGREGRIDEPLRRDLVALSAEVADGLFAHLGERFALFGHSMGALLAVEVARRLQERGRVPGRVVVSGRAAVARSDPRDVRLMSDKQVTDFLRGLGGTPRAILDDAETMAAFLPVIRADIEMVASYEWSVSPALECPLSVFRGLSDGAGRGDDYTGWRQLSAVTSLHAFAGGHFFPFEPGRRDALDLLTAQLTARPLATTGGVR